MDAFEASTKLNQILRSLTPSIQNLTKAAHFTLKNWEGEDYLFQSIVDTLDDDLVDLNTKSTIFQFIEVLIHESYYVSEQPKSHYNYPYVHNVKNALPKLLLQVLPDSNNASLYNIFTSLKNMSKVFKFDYVDYELKYDSVSEEFSQDELENVELNIPFPSITLDEENESMVDPLILTWDLLIKKKKQSQYERLRLLRHGKYIEQPVNEDDMFNIKIKSNRIDSQSSPENKTLTKKQILARMEDDRETYKRSKESLWMVNRPKDANVITEDEFLVHYWNKINKMSGEEEKELFDSFDELNNLVAQSYKDKQF